MYGLMSARRFRPVRHGVGAVADVDVRAHTRLKSVLFFACWKPSGPPEITAPPLRWDVFAIRRAQSDRVRRRVDSTA